MIGKHQPEINALVREFWSEPERNGRAPRVEDSGVSHLADEEVLERISRDGERFRAAYDGILGNHYATRSDAVWALLKKLAFYTSGDRGQIERLMRGSQLDAPPHSPKFDRRQSGSTWLAIQIDKALAETTDHYSPSRRSRNDRPLRAGESGPVEDDAPPPTAEDDPGSTGPERNGKTGNGGNFGDDLPPELELTDLGNSLRFARRFEGKLIYSPGTGGYAAYRDGRYVRDELGSRFEHAKAVPKEFMAEALTLADSDAGRAKAFAKHGVNSSARPRIESMVALAHSDPRIAVASDKLDADPFTFNCANGTVDLRTGGLRRHNPADRLTKIAPVEYVEGAECPAWLRFLEEVLPDQELRVFLKRWFGWCLTGVVKHEILPVFYGTGKNGKSTLVNALLDILGDYGQQAPQDLLVVKRREHPTELADLFGRRLVASAEPEENVRLNESLVKQLTGRERVRARYMRQDFFEFEPTHKLLLLTNHKPIVQGSDDGIWRRLKVVPFEVSIPEPKQDKSLPAKLRAEYPGILQWAIEGCLEWQREGLPGAQKIDAASDEYREEQDVIGAFFDECCILDQPEDVHVLMSTLYPAYQEWCKQSGEGALSKKHFGDRLTEKGYPPERGPRNKPARRRMTLRDDAPRPDGGGPRFDYARGDSGYPTDSNETPTNANNAKSQGNTCYPVESQGNAEKSCKTEESTEGVTLGYPDSVPKSNRNPRVRGDAGSRVTQGNKVTLTAEQEHFVERLCAEGMARKWAIAEVLGDETTDDISAKTNDSSGGEA